MGLRVSGSFVDFIVKVEGKHPSRHSQNLCLRLQKGP